MNRIISATVTTLSKSKNLLTNLTDAQLSDASVAPYYSCVGSHIRHILDFYDCLLNGLEEGLVDLSARKRDVRIEQECGYAEENVDRIVDRLESISLASSTILKVTDDLGQGPITIDYTLGSLMAQANSHTIHHYAIVSYILNSLNIAVKDTSFGYNPTTPQKVEQAS